MAALPVNIILSAALLLFLFHGKDLGSTTQKVSYTDEEGKAVERIIPKSEFRKKVALFYFDNETGDLEKNWLQYGMVNALEMDLAQQVFGCNRKRLTKLNEQQYMEQPYGHSP